MLLLAGCRLGHSAQFHQDFLLAEDQILLVVDLDVVAGIFAEQDPVTHLYVERDAMALFHLAGSDGHYFALLRLFFSRIGDDDPLYVERDAMALFHLAGSDGHYFALLRLFFSRIGDDDPALCGFFLFQPAYEDTVM